MTPVEEQEHQRRHEKRFFIPACTLIGLGTGLIAGYPGPGILIGLGFGFLAQAFYTSAINPVPDSGASCCGSGNRWVSVVIGLFMIVLGAGIIWAPAHLWPYIIGIFMIVLGIIIAAKSLGKGS